MNDKFLAGLTKLPTIYLYQYLALRHVTIYSEITNAGSFSVSIHSMKLINELLTVSILHQSSFPSSSPSVIQSMNLDYDLSPNLTSNQTSFQIIILTESTSKGPSLMPTPRQSICPRQNTYRFLSKWCPPILSNTQVTSRSLSTLCPAYFPIFGTLSISGFDISKHYYQK